MKKKSRLRKYYFLHVVRPWNVFRLSLMYFYGRLALFLSLRGIKLPGFTKIRSRLPTPVRQAYERQALVWEMRGELFLWRTGPLWFRQFVDRIGLLLRSYRFSIWMTIKIGVGLFFIAIPISLFILIRGILPVPDRISYQKIPAPLEATSFLKTAWPYTRNPVLIPEWAPRSLLTQKTRGAWLTPLAADGGNLPSYLIALGDDPAQIRTMQGFIVGSQGYLSLKSRLSSPSPRKGKLRIQYALLPSPTSQTFSCRLELRTAQGDLLAYTTQDTPSQSPSQLSRLAKAWRERFTPQFSQSTGPIGELELFLEDLPYEIQATVHALSPGEDSPQSFLTPHLFSPAVNSFQETDPCLFAVGDWSFEYQSQSALARRGILLIAVDNLNAQTAYNPALAPRFHSFATTQALPFLEHRAHSHQAEESLISLLRGQRAAPSKDMSSSVWLAERLEHEGYRVGALGNLAPLTSALGQGKDTGFRNMIIENSPGYGTRRTSEEMGEWLSQYGHAPFFLFVRYHTMEGPYKPPFADLDVSGLLSKPFGLNQKKQLYEGLVRSWDEEWGFVEAKIKDLGLWDQLDIIVTASQGAPFLEQPWNQRDGIAPALTGSLTEGGHTFFDEEVRVPLVMRIAQSTTPIEAPTATPVEAPTAHSDLAPTLYGLAHSHSVSPVKNPFSQGFDLHGAFLQHPSSSGAALSAHIGQIVQKRQRIDFESTKYTGVLFWDGLQAPIKYMRQRERDAATLYLTHNPWSVHVNWFQQEAFGAVDFQNHTERWLAHADGKSVLRARQHVFLSPTAASEIHMKNLVAGALESRFELEKKEVDAKMAPDADVPLVKALPAGMSYQTHRIGTRLVWTFSGQARRDEILSLHWGAHWRLKSVALDSQTSVQVCGKERHITPAFLAKILNEEVCLFSFPFPLVSAKSQDALSPKVMFYRTQPQ